MENFTGTTAENNAVGLDFAAITHLSETRKWTMFLSILGFVFLALMLLVVLFFIFAGRELTQSHIPMIAMFPMLLLGVVYFFPIYYLFQFSRYSKLAIKTMDTTSMSLAMKYLKLHYRFIGILAIIVAGLYLIFFVTMIAAGSLLQEFM